MIFGRNQTPHPSHDMTQWEDTIVQISNTPRFGDLRTCKQCDGEHARTAAGEAMHDVLALPCPYAETQE